MFDLLTRYLLEHKRLAIPHTGVFELTEKRADADYMTETIAPPAWEAVFTEDRNISSPDELLISRISSDTGITAAEARQRFEEFTVELKQRLSRGEEIEWENIGRLHETDGKILFIPYTGNFSPFTGVAAKKIVREEFASHETLVGDNITTTSEMREKLNGRDVKRGGGNRIMWILFGAALLAAAWYFSQNGCNKQATGNRQPVQTTAPGDTYKIQ